MSTATPAETSVASWVAHAPTGPVDTRRSPHAALRTLDLAAARLRGGPLLQRQQTCLRVSLAFGAEQLEEHGNFHDLKLTAGLAQGPYKGPVYIDSDLHKWLEAVAWACADRSNADDPDVRPMLTRTIDLLAAAQAEDGYLNSHFQVKDPAGRFRDLTGAHELYCFGHLAQAVLFDDQAGLNCFTQADFVTQHATSAKTAQGGLGGFNLVREGVEVQAVQADEFVETADEQHVGGGQL